MDKENIEIIFSSLGLSCTESDEDQIMAELAEKVNDLLVNDFNKLVSVLYRLDIDERKIRTVISGNPRKDAGLLIAGLMIERQLLKIKSRRESRRDDNGINEEERW